MSDYMQKIEEATKHLESLQQKRDALWEDWRNLGALATECEVKARIFRAEMAQKKQELAQLEKDFAANKSVLGNYRVLSRIEQAQQESEAVLASNLAKQKQLDELLAQHGK